MKLSPEIVEEILQADNKALATYGKHGINVVPVSTVRVVDGTILLMNYFMNKTIENILENQHVALSCWKGMKGCQIKGTISYVSEGAIFEEAKDWIEKNVSNRTLKGLLVLTPQSVHTVTP
ncbi:MAG: pyridoxamine 5'-phosphate oxidase family protein [Candidatus Pacebacteria bacterium]|nr:pyridoxamine 5'-phosphate oxidase family protein [Candidatus Paceibacterota bacterium]